MSERDDLRELLRAVEGALKPRRLSRQVVTIPVTVRSQREEVDGDGRDLTEHGIRVRSQKQLHVGRRVTVALAPPGAPEPILFDATVRWSRSEERSFLAGLEFARGTGPGPKLRQLLLDLADGRLPQLKRSGQTTRRMRS